MTNYDWIRFAEGDGDRSPMTKAVTGHRTPNLPRGGTDLIAAKIEFPHTIFELLAISTRPLITP